MGKYIDLFKNLTFTDEEKDREKEDFEKYIKLKGTYLHQWIYDIIDSIDGKVSYKEISQVISYDKYIRNVLYRYLSAYEEQLRSELFNKLEYDDTIENILNKKIDNSKIVFKQDDSKSNFYFASFNKYFTFGKLIDIIKLHREIFEIEATDAELLKIADLRNKVMHHNLLLISYYKTTKEIDNNIKDIENAISLLWRFLDYHFREAFTYNINNGNFKKGDSSNGANLDRFCLGVFKDGIFNKKEN